ncbi:MAG: hypothetical protein ACPGJV_00690 [Bacteriovoracaceae bacterium]
MKGVIVDLPESVEEFFKSRGVEIEVSKGEAHWRSLETSSYDFICLPLGYIGDDESLEVPCLFFFGDEDFDKVSSRQEKYDKEFFTPLDSDADDLEDLWPLIEASSLSSGEEIELEDASDELEIDLDEPDMAEIEKVASESDLTSDSIQIGFDEDSLEIDLSEAAGESLDLSESGEGDELNIDFDESGDADLGEEINLEASNEDDAEDLELGEDLDLVIEVPTDSSEDDVLDGGELSFSIPDVDESSEIDSEADEGGVALDLTEGDGDLPDQTLVANVEDLQAHKTPNLSEEENSQFEFPYKTGVHEELNLSDELDDNDEEVDFSTESPTRITVGGSAGSMNEEPEDDSQDILSQSTSSESSEVLNFGGISDERELLELQKTLRELREERQKLYERVHLYEDKNEVLRQENLTLKSELDEMKIELSIYKKRQLNDREELKDRLRLSEEKKLFYEERIKKLQRDFDKAQQKVSIDVEKVRNRERELENQLELMKMDSESQIKARDEKIIELKRRVDSLEFNVRSVSQREQRNLEEKLRLETRLDKALSSLRSSIHILEEELPIEEGKIENF